MKIRPIGLILIGLIAVGVSAYCSSALFKNTEGTCGDGICEKEEACKICPQDCQDPNIVCCKSNSPTDGRCADFNCRGDADCPKVHPQPIRSGRLPKWNEERNLIVFDDFVNEQGSPAACKRNPLSCNYEILTMEPDGSGVKCLTCGKSNLAKAGYAGHKGQPYWHPSGDYIVFTAENTNYERWRKGKDLTVVPVISGRNNDVLIMNTNGDNFWQITNVPESGGSIRASFSPDGTMLYWNEEYSLEEHGKPSKWSLKLNPLGEKWGLWRIIIADIDLASEKPVVTNQRIVNINKLYPNKVLIEGQGIQPDNKTLVFVAADINETAGCCQWGWPPKDIFGYCHWSDVYTVDLRGDNLKRLTNTPYLHNENPEFSPDGGRIIFSETQWCVGKGADMYMMNSDGSERRRLTHFHNKNCPDDYLGFYKGGVGEADWSPDGRKIIFSPGTAITIRYPHMNFTIYKLDVRKKGQSNFQTPQKK